MLLLVSIWPLFAITIGLMLWLVPEIQAGYHVFASFVFICIEDLGSS